MSTEALIAGNLQIANPDVVTAGLPVCVPSACCTSVQCLDAAAAGTDGAATSELHPLPLYLHITPGAPPPPNPDSSEPSAVPVNAPSQPPPFTSPCASQAASAFPHGGPPCPLSCGSPVYPATLSQHALCFTPLFSLLDATLSSGFMPLGSWAYY